MGWYTEIVIIVENIKSKRLAMKIGQSIFEKDSRLYEKETFYILKVNLGYSIYYTYERRKVIPYWVILLLSESYPDLPFTLLGSCPEFLCGPAGLIRIRNGKILDSYGFWYENSKRALLLEEPVKYREIIFNWFREGGQEQLSRNTMVDDFPLGWCNDNFSEKLVPITDSKELVDAFELEEWKSEKCFWELQEKY